jgi:hypothetical protein
MTLVNSEEIFFNGTHNLPKNHTKVEVTTVKIAEIINHKSSSSNATIVVREKTAQHFVTSTASSKVVLIPPAKIDSQIVRKKNVHKS